MAENTANGKRKMMAFITLGLLAAVCAAALFVYLNYKQTHISTDDAFIDGNIHTIASKIPGTIKQILIKDNQLVKAGDLLVLISPEDYQARQQEASAALMADKAKYTATIASFESSKKKLNEIRLSAASAKADLQLNEANMRQAERDLKRADDLYKKEAISKERYEQALTSYEAAAARATSAKENLARALSSIDTQKAVIEEASAAVKVQASEINKKQAALSSAELNVGYTKIFAPVDGMVTKRTVQTGNQIQPGQALMAVVPLDNIWVTANYKETQLKNVKHGQRVRIKVDMYPDKKFEGRVDSIMAGTGSAFSLFPPENATGNYVKIVQRIPVKIIFEKPDAERILRVGMSVVPTIIVK
ncbi:MAG: HlyD family secretion protein [Nitrospiraceae bacterium]|nr:HlyD family secretion protein [Nitrospiraceae bacterium]